MDAKTFVLVFMDGRDDGATAAPAGQRPGPLPALWEVLGIGQAELGEVRFRGLPLFDTSGADSAAGPGAVDDFLTVVSLRTIVHQGCPGLAVVSLSSAELFGRAGFPSRFAGLSPVAVGISTTFAFSAESVARVSRRVRELLPGCRIILGGAGITLNPDWYDRANADIAVLGDAERALPLVLNALSTAAPVPSSIPNLVFRTPSGDLVRTARSQVAIDEIPTPRWDLAHEGRWPSLVWYESQRGCPFRCAFCSYPNQALTWAVKSPERMLEEFEYYSARGVTTIECFDSTMVTPPRRMAAFCALVLARGLRVRWHCYAHAASLQDPALTRTMYEAGCRSVSIGLESCDETVLRAMRKQVSPEQLRRAVANCTGAGVICAVNIIVGFPGETTETYRHTVDALVEMEPDTIGIQPFQVRDRTIPILQMENAHLAVGPGSQPDWRHDGMDRAHAARLAREAMWEIAVRSERTIIPAVGAAARAPMAPLNDAAASRYWRTWLNPVVNGYGRILCFDPRLSWIDGFLGRPEMLQERSEREASRHRDRTLRQWEQAMVAAAE